MSKLKNIMVYIVNILLILLLAISVIASITNIGNQFQACSPKFIFYVLLLYFILGSILYFYPQALKWVITLIHKRKKVLLVLGIGLIICWQLLMVIGLSGNMQWDPGIVSYVAAQKSITNWYPDYFSYYPNNLFLLYLERVGWCLLQLFGINSYGIFLIVLNSLNYFMLDVSTIILYIALKRIFSNRVAMVAGVITIVLLDISPIGVIPYSDILAFFISSLFLLLYSFKESNIVVIGLGILSAIAFLIKPSLIIFDIALLIVKLIYCTKWTSLVKTSIIFSTAFLVLYVPFNMYQSNNSIIKIDSSKKMPANHFVAMGMAEIGGFNENDVKENQKIKNPQKRKEYNNELIKQRLNHFGMEGYVKFLILKQANNTNDAGFGWGMDAGQNYLLPFSEKIAMQKLARKVFINKDAYVDINWKGSKIIVQLIWTIVLILILVIVIRSREKLLLMKLTVLGGLVFLLLFEGGRSRYLIQFLPYMITLASIGATTLHDKYKNRIKENF